MNSLAIKLQRFARALDGRSPVPSDAEMKARLEEIRESMLDELGAVALSLAPVARRIRRATDVQTLWYLRGDLMAVLAAKEGEIIAASRIEELSEMFAGLLPRGLDTRGNRVKAPERPVA